MDRNREENFQRSLAYRLANYILFESSFRYKANAVRIGPSADIIEVRIKHSPLQNEVQIFDLSENRKAVGKGEYLKMEVSDRTVVNYSKIDYKYTTEFLGDIVIGQNKTVYMTVYTESNKINYLFVFLRLLTA